MNKTLNKSGSMAVLFFLMFFTCFALHSQKKGEKIAFLLTSAEKHQFSKPELTYKTAREALGIAIFEEDTLSFAKAKCHLGIYHVYNGNVNEGEQLLKQSLALFQKLQHQKGMVQCLLELGEIKYNKAEYDASLHFFFKANTIAKKISYRHGEAEAMNYIGKFHHSKGNFKKSHRFYLKALKLAEDIKDIELIITVRNHLGKHFETLADYDRALKEYMKVYRLLPETKNMVLIATTYNHLGNVFQETGETEDALLYHKEALKYRKEIRYVEGIAKSEKNIGEIFELQGKLDSALLYYQSSYTKCKQTGYTKGMIKSLYLSGNICRKKKLYSRAAHFYLQSIELAEQVGYEKGMLYSYQYLAELYIQQQKYDSATEYLQKGINISGSDELIGIITDFYQLMYKIHNQQQNYKQALDYYQLYSNSINKLRDIETAQNVEKVKLAFESERQEQQNELLRQENQLKTLALQRKNSLIFAIAVAFILLLLVTFLFYYRSKAKTKTNQMLAKLNQQVTKKNRELALLNKELDKANHDKDKFFSIIGHEVRNPLWWFKNLSESLSKRFETMDQEKLQKALGSLNDSAKTAFHLIDNLLQWSKKQLGRVSYHPKPMDIVDLIHRNNQLFKPEMEAKKISLNLYFDDPAKVIADPELVDTVLRNLISNAVKYTPDFGTIDVRISMMEDVAEISIKDNGIGIPDVNQKKLFDPQSAFTTLGLYQEKGSGLGLLLCKEFIELNGGNIWMKSTEGQGTTFYFTLPLAMEQVPA